MSRIIVKGLPKYLNEDRLQDHFYKRLQKVHSDTTNLITDVKLMKNKDGESRRFAFVGFKFESDAFDAVEYFDGSFIDTCKLEVSMAKSFADPRVPVPMREKRREALKRLREREDKLLQENQRKHRKETKPGIDAEIAKNAQLQEFIDTMKPSNQVTSWEKVVSTNKVEDSNNGDDSNPLLKVLKGAEEDEDVDMFKLSDGESDEEYIDVDKTKMEQDVPVDQEEETKMMSLDTFENTQLNKDDNLAQDEGVSDLDWLKNRRVRIRDGEDQAAQASISSEVPGVPVQQQSEIEEKQVPPISDEEQCLSKIRASGRLFLRNILYTAKEDDFQQLFAPYGEIEEIHIAVDTRTGQSKGFAYVLFKNPDDAVNAYIELDKQIFQGRLLHILPADPKKSHRLDEFDIKNLPLKKQKELKRKASAAQQIFSWNSLYMNQDAILSSVASKLGMEKSQLIDPENSSSAVKQALAEAHVIGDVRKYFELRGVDLTAFQKYKNAFDRDDRIILVKNFPHGTTREELAELFLPFGKLLRLLMPPSGTIAIVQYRDVPSARAAFSKLSYKRFKEGILYLEKGPKNCFSRNAEGDELVEDGTTEPEEKFKEAKATVDDVMAANRNETLNEHDDLDTQVHGPTTSIFVKNLNFSTKTEDLTDKFKSFAGFIVAQIKTKPDPKRKGKTQSMGFGFVEFRTKEQANAVISALEGTVIDGHKIQLKLSHRQGTASTAKTSKKNINGKIIVKNLPFEATRKDIFELFSSFGQLKSVRVPKKFDKSARGFAFVEFLLPKEAENAMDQLEGVHLLGRRLVMQYAEQESEDAELQIEKMTNRMKKQVATTKLAAMRNTGKRKLQLDEDNENDGFDG
ncbi:RNA-binding ribosome biosynthesis protein MRD1 Ecym_4446 [Eremothecium cymbalariae DBVPG|uniref:Multiple RNA-binding domain-containing protein 1 n=1 Tax=Eremothecium cymbalariae (strain CBS 270.75 / DBVPG 7215 / KCTC 17166 / NRRL Y-17582) TaxID=931890 RepID=G8JTY8_ERECY|nr:hypothetical protein Ecym_4446 [Eremothecium cymbalariae DBVPG\